MQVGLLAKETDCPGCDRSHREVYCAPSQGRWTEGHWVFGGTERVGYWIILPGLK